MENALCYIRQSRTENNPRWQNQQESSCQSYAEKNKLNILQKYTDVCSGYTSIPARMGLVTLLNRCATDAIPNIIISDVSRLTRSVRDGVLLLDWMHRRGIKLHISSYKKRANIPDYITILKDLVKSEELYHRYSKHKSIVDELYMLASKGPPPVGYVKMNGRLNKCSNEGTKIEELFEIALQEKKDNPTASINMIAETLEKIIKPYRSKQSIARILKHPVYTGRELNSKALGNVDLSDVSANESLRYVRDEDFNLINNFKKKRKLEYTKLLYCLKCKGDVVMDGENFRCRNCGYIKQTIFHKEMIDLCSKYNFGHFADFLGYFTSTRPKQINDLLKNITDLGKTSTGVFITPDEDKNVNSQTPETIQLSTCGVQQNQNVLTKSLADIYILLDKHNLSLYNVAVHYYLRMQENDQGKALHDLIGMCFGRIGIAVGRIKPKAGPGVKRISPDSVSGKLLGATQHKGLHKNLDNFTKEMKEHMNKIREILNKTPFLTDYLAYHIIDNSFNQWEHLLDYIERFAGLDAKL